MFINFFKLKNLYILKARLFYLCSLINKFLNLFRVLLILKNIDPAISAPLCCFDEIVEINFTMDGLVYLGRITIVPDCNNLRT